MLQYLDKVQGKCWGTLLSPYHYANKNPTSHNSKFTAVLDMAGPPCWVLSELQSSAPRTAARHCPHCESGAQTLTTDYGFHPVELKYPFGKHYYSTLIQCHKQLHFIVMKYQKSHNSLNETYKFTTKQRFTCLKTSNMVLSFTVGWCNKFRTATRQLMSQLPHIPHRSNLNMCLRMKNKINLSRWKQLFSWRVVRNCWPLNC